MRVQSGAVLLVTLVAASGCNPTSKKESVANATALLQVRQARLDRALAHPDSISTGAPVARWILPAQLHEISGLALTSDGRLFTHGDERGKIFEIDYRRGVIVKDFTLGPPAAHGDFESIAIVRDSMYLLTSDGVLFHFAEGAKDANVAFTTHNTGLGAECEFEGMAFDSAANTLLLACKGTRNKALLDSIVIFRVPLASGADGRAPRVTHLAVALTKVVSSNGWDGFHPSDLTIDPVTHNYILVASREKALVEITPSGDVLRSQPLQPGHDQAEGAAITRDHLLIIADEAKGGPALLTLYRWP